MIRERPKRLQSVEAVQVLLFTGGVSCGSAAVYVRLLLCGSIAAFYAWCTPDMRFCCGVLYLVHVRYTVLLWRFMFGVRPICGSVAAFCSWFTSGIRFYCGVLCSITPAVCRLCAKQDGLRDVAFLYRRVEIAIRAFSGCWRGYRAWWERGTGLRGDALSVAALALGLRSAMRFRCGVLHLVHVRYTVLLRRFVFDHACCLSFDKQDGLRDVAFLFRRVEIAIRAFSRCWRGYLPWLVHFGFGRFFMAISTGLPGTRGMRGTGLRGAGGAAFMLFCATTLALLCFPRGVRWG